MTDIGLIRQLLRQVVFSQKLGVISTHGQGQSHASLVAFAPAEDLAILLFATSRRTRKYQNLADNPHGSMLIDTRTPDDPDFTATRAVTASGLVMEFTGVRLRTMTGIYLDRHPGRSGFLQDPDCALMGLIVETYLHVDALGNLTRWRVPGRG